MKAYYGNRFSPNMTKTPEGYLVCHNVPIARTGWQKYLPREIGVNGEGLVDVYRSEQEVFSPATIASFEGKPVTDGHYPGGVDACNYSAAMKGVTQNVRRGSGEQSDYLLADLVIYDAALICSIEAGKREVSCGYDCCYEPYENNSYAQGKIAGNHVAIVERGRAGNRVSIKDEKPEVKEKMSKKNSIWDRMLSAFTKDAEPDEVKEAQEAVDSINELETEKKKTDDTAARLLQMDQRLASIEKYITKDSQTEEEKTALDELEKELEQKETDDTDEESVTVEPEDVGEGQKNADSAPFLAVIKVMKPVVAALPKEQRQSVSDAMSKAMREAMKVKPTQSATYAQMVTRKVADQAAKQDNKAAYGDACRSRNPHYKGGK